EGGLEHDARALRRDLRQQIAVIGMQSSRDTHAALRARAVAEAPDVARAYILVGEAIVLRQVLRRLRRTALGEILRRCARHEPRLAELARDQVIRARRPDADGEVEAFLDEVDHAVGERYVEAHLGMAAEEFGDRRTDMAHAEIH